MKNKRASSSAAFTLIELVVVISIITVLSGLFLSRTGTFRYWQQETFLRRLLDTLVFLHHQAIADQAYYRLEFEFDSENGDSYRVGVMRPESAVTERLQELAQGAGNISLELAAYLHPYLGEAQTMIPPPSFPSMAEPQRFPDGVELIDVRTMRGKETEGNPFILFSPRGFSEFSVIHLRLTRGQEMTILVNPFTGLTEVYGEYKDFEWTYGRDDKKS